MIPLFKVFMAEDVDIELHKVLHSGFIGQGPKVEEFEAALKQYIGNPNMVTTNSGTAALQLALRLIDVKDRYVISTPMTCTATNWAILAEGGKIQWADIDRYTGNISPTSIMDMDMSLDPVAIMAVDWGGTPIDHSFFDFRRIPVIEDAAHAFGSRWYRKMTGTMADYTIFSFQAIKAVTCGDGGALFLKDDSDVRRSKLLRWYGIDREQPRADFRCEQNIPEWGYKFHMNDIAATIGLANLPFVETNLATCRNHADFYDQNLSSVSGLGLPPRDVNVQPSYWLYTLFVEHRDDFMRMMNEKGIMCSRVHERNDLHTCVEQFRTDLPNTQWFVGHECCIPVGWWVTEEDREFIVKTIKGGW
jgi:dTDP-4-amino-4,6-dideoxygalactose transaminase